MTSWPVDKGHVFIHLRANVHVCHLLLLPVTLDKAAVLKVHFLSRLLWIQSLLEGGADVNCAGPRNNTPLHLACSRGNLAAVKTLVANGADLNATGQADERPLHVVRCDFERNGLLCMVAESC